MNDTCATHRSRVPRRSFGRNKRRSDDIGRRERTRPGFYFMFCVWQSSVRGCRFSVMFVFIISKCLKCSPVPASFFPYLSTSLHIYSLINLLTFSFSHLFYSHKLYTLFFSLTVLFYSILFYIYLKFQSSNRGNDVVEFN